MSIDFSDYKKKLKEKKLPKFKVAAGGDMPARIANLAQHSDTADRDYFTYRNYHGTVNSYVERKEASKTNDGKRNSYLIHLQKMVSGNVKPGQTIDAYIMNIYSNNIQINLFL